MQSTREYITMTQVVVVMVVMVVVVVMVVRGCLVKCRKKPSHPWKCA